jgi:AAA domain, putative AbiEii toxin, Type IV TA system
MAGITSVSVAGYKSIANEQTIEIRPLTILAGANSSGKSSIMQPLLLLKQTLDAQYDPGPLLLDGPNVNFTSAEQLFSTINGKVSTRFSVRMEVNGIESIEARFARDPKQGIQIYEVAYRGADSRKITLSRTMSQESIRKLVRRYSWPLGGDSANSGALKIVPNRFLLHIRVEHSQSKSSILDPTPANCLLALLRIIHVPGFRSNPERTYKKSALGPMFHGQFQNYIASIINDWQSRKRSKEFAALGRALEELGLTSKIETRSVGDSQFEIRVGRSARTKTAGGDLVNIADVGLGVSQVLPVIVALLVAGPGDLVYLEEPEIQLHPRAQVHLASILAQAAKRSVIVVAETHSSLLLRRIQTIVASAELDPKIVKLHWFKRSQVDGSTTVRSADLDSEGAFGPWPSDFGDVSLNAEKEYLDAVYGTGKRQLNKGARMESYRRLGHATGHGS